MGSNAQEIRFDDGAAYERYMGQWSQATGQVFLDWLALPQGLRWLDIGCGNGAFTELLYQRQAPAAVYGIDPSAEQLAYARARPTLQAAQFQVADAMALPFADGSFDVAVMPLVIFFVPDPVKGLAEMRRVLRPGGMAASYTWGMESGGFPYALLRDCLEEIGVGTPQPPSPDASGAAALRKLWRDAGLQQVQERAIEVQRVFASFDDYWQTVLGGPSVGRRLAALSRNDKDRLQALLRQRLIIESDGRVMCIARANAIQGRVSA